MVPSSVIKGMFGTFASSTLLSQPRLVSLHKGRWDLLALFCSFVGLLSPPSLLPTYHELIHGRAWHQRWQAQLGQRRSIQQQEARFKSYQADSIWQDVDSRGDEVDSRQDGMSSLICVGKMSREESIWASRISIGHHAELELDREEVQFED